MGVHVNRPFWELIGMEILESKEGRSRVELPVKIDITQSRGSVHGGAIASLIDSTTGSAIRSLLFDNQYIATIEMKINYLRPAVGEKLIGIGKTTKFGKTLAFGESVIVNDEGIKVATGSATFRVFTE